MRVLGIETSCDETGIALYDSQLGLLNHQIFSQSIHQEYGGVVPELASRDHVHKVLPLIDAVLKESATSVEGIAYTAGPGLMGALLVGAVIGHTLAFAQGCPVIGVHHLEGHLLAAMLEPCAPQFPFVTLLVSGGHTQLIKVSQLGSYEILGESLDDAAGEAFDKTAKLLGLPYPGGPHLAQLAKAGCRTQFNFPRPLINQGLNFSFSGLKTAVAQTIRHATLSAQRRADIAAAFETAVIETLITKARRALAHTGLNQLVIAGGVGANEYLRQQLNQANQPFNVYYPRPSFCTDNGAMIAYAGCQRLLRGERSDTLKVRARWPLSELCPPHFNFPSLP